MGSDEKCYEKAVARGDRTFTLVGRDKSSPRTICFWIMENIETAPSSKLREALESALIMKSTFSRRAAD
jgi:hypothetical protein